MTPPLCHSQNPLDPHEYISNKSGDIVEVWVPNQAAKNNPCLQAVLFQAVFVNNLLSQPLAQVSMLFWSGITMYNLCQGFSSPQDALKYFEFDKKFHAELSSRLSLWCSLLDMDINAATVPVQTKRRNRKKKTVDKNESRV